ncbi:MAG: class I SAM-dependent methyltransferase [Lentisphaeria bacterium]|nr:class I SAM-dependent methyltransferase [Lentisphaeria bacterium]
MTAPHIAPDMRPQGFYNAMASRYDRMVGFENRLATAREFVRELGRRTDTPRGSAAVDLGCGTGAYALALAGDGFSPAWGVDIAAEMLSKAREHAARLGIRATFVEGDLTALPALLPWAGTDLVLCLGNTLPHLIEPADLGRSLGQMHGLLRPGGAAVLQTLNYGRILARRERVVSIDRDGDWEFLRFYDFLDNGLLGFNLLTIEWRQGRAREPVTLTTTLLRPYRQQELEEAAAAHGFRIADRLGSLGFSPFDPAESDTLILLLRRISRDRPSGTAGPTARPMPARTRALRVRRSVVSG